MRRTFLLLIALVLPQAAVADEPKKVDPVKAVARVVVCAAHYRSMTHAAYRRSDQEAAKDFGAKGIYLSQFARKNMGAASFSYAMATSNLVTGRAIAMMEEDKLAEFVKRNTTSCERLFDHILKAEEG
ncbi:MAG: hypothetical protein AAFO70_04740 [Pseudomonadota bacterium]